MTVVFVIYCNAASIYVHMSVMYTNHVAHVQVYIYIYILPSAMTGPTSDLLAMRKKDAEAPILHSPAVILLQFAFTLLTSSKQIL